MFNGYNGFGAVDQGLINQTIVNFDTAIKKQFKRSINDTEKQAIMMAAQTVRGYNLPVEKEGAAFLAIVKNAASKLGLNI